ncbi:ribonuclease P [Sulfolobus sp. S-194]|uniref:ribonuclease P protein subunit n=1 Tax=Sulfolobus sp. S-194 TaxID=2512240 RepID=UPI00143703F9|nr:ribonuclease P protein subunit [Sulfolobus sp. S-194]QIW23284.1 ribonuclease P [Sulfolobus sp. S-194]
MIDLIGSKVKILGHSDPSLIGREGIILFETKKTFLIQTQNKIIRVLKSNGIFEIYSENRKVIFPGYKLVGRIEKRWS